MSVRRVKMKKKINSCIKENEPKKKMNTPPSLELDLAALEAKLVNLHI
jgi:hypothetical protein